MKYYKLKAVIPTEFIFEVKEPIVLMFRLGLLKPYRIYVSYTIHTN